MLWFEGLMGTIGLSWRWSDGSGEWVDEDQDRRTSQLDLFVRLGPQMISVPRIEKDKEQLFSTDLQNISKTAPPA